MKSKSDMKKYVVKYKDSEKVYGEYSSRKEASDKLMEHINNFNKYFEGEYLSPFDFVLEVVECDDVNEEITDFESARKYLKLEGPNKKNTAPLIALDQLFTIAEAWNKADGFVQDFSDCAQFKWIPCFKYDKDAARFVYHVSSYTTEYASACLGPHFCFMTLERAEQFGKQFEELFNKVFMLNK